MEPVYLVNGQYVNANGEPVEQPEPEQPEHPEAEAPTPEADEQPAPKRRRITSGD